MSVTGSKQQRKTQQKELIGRTLRDGEYRIDAVLGQGGMGQVFLATHVHLQKPFAIKQARADQPMPESVVMEIDRLLYETSATRHTVIAQAPDSEFPLSGGTHTDRFLREVLFLARLQHSCIPALYDYFFEDGYWYLVMDYIVGPTLSSYMRERQRLHPLEALNYALQLCDVLDYLHEQTPPVIYRDLKPSNILLSSDGRVMLVDFGIARYYKEGQENDTVEFGSPGYAPPEQYQGGGQTDGRSDLYSLGVILHEMLSGQRPVGYGEKLESLHYLHPEISPILSGLISVATRAEPMYRFQSATTFFLALERAYAIEERRAYQRYLENGDAAAESADDEGLPQDGEQWSDSAPGGSQEHIQPSSAVQPLPAHVLAAAAHDYIQQQEQLRLAIQEGRRERMEYERAEQRLASVDERLERSSSMGLPIPPLAPQEPPNEEQPAYPELAYPELEDLPLLPRPRRTALRVVQASFLLALIAFLLLASFHFYNSTARVSHNQPTPKEAHSAQTIIPTTTTTTIVTETPVEKSSWQALPSLPSPEADNAAIYAREQGQAYIYVSGGFRGFKESPPYDHSLYRYDIAAAHWDTVSSNFPVMLNNAAATDAQGQFYFTAGYSPDLHTIPSWLYMYEPASGALTKIAPPSTITPGYGAAILDDQQGHLYISQGFLQAGKPRAQAGTGWYRYDIASGQWHTLAPLPQGLGYVLLAQDGQGNIILFGGTTEAGEHSPSQQIYRYNVAQNAWSAQQQPAPATLSGAAGCQSGPDRFVIVGANAPSNNATHNQSWVVNLQSMQWTALTGLPGDGSLLGAAACDGNGHVYLVRGANNASNPTADFLSLTVRH